MPKLTVTMPRIYFPECVWKRLLAYIDHCPTEVGGLGTVELVDGALVVNEIFLLPQDVSIARTVFDRDALERFTLQWIDDGRHPALLRFWWHSHATFPTVWSSVDYAMMKQLTAGGNWLLSFVGNHKHEWRMRFTTQQPFPMAVDNLPCIVIPEFNAALTKSVAEEIAIKVRPIKRSFWNWPWELLLSRHSSDDKPLITAIGRDDDFTDHEEKS